MCEVIPLFRDKTARTQQSRRLAANTHKAAQAAERLAREGYTVLRVDVSATKPMIWVQAGTECGRLRGTCYRREHKPSGTVYTFEACYAGACIKWQTTEPSPLGAA